MYHQSQENMAKPEYLKTAAKLGIKKGGGSRKLLKTVQEDEASLEIFLFFFFFFFFFVFLPLLWLLPRHMEVPRLGVQSEL